MTGTGSDRTRAVRAARGLTVASVALLLCGGVVQLFGDLGTAAAAPAQRPTPTHSLAASRNPSAPAAHHTPRYPGWTTNRTTPPASTIQTTAPAPTATVTAPATEPTYVVPQPSNPYPGIGY